MALKNIERNDPGMPDEPEIAATGHPKVCSRPAGSVPIFQARNHIEETI